MRQFKQISTRPGFLKNNGGLLLKKINSNKFIFKTKIKKIHLNRAGNTHGGYICSIIDAGAGTAAHSNANKRPCVTVSLDIKFIAPTKFNDEIIGNVLINKKTKSLIFLNCTLKSKNKIIATSSGIWKILRHKNYDTGYNY
tara:strand:- start:269 stop:691 length:423 start_codon:yes stop_codon:yes gene_type:complete